MKPGIIGIGAQKCASSWLHAIAGSHPEIGISAPKELDFFSYYFDRGYRWYEGHFAPQPTASVYFESSPSYFHDPRAPERAYRYDRDLKILALLRHPVDRAFSNHMHEIIKGHIPPSSFEDAVGRNPAYLEQGLYATHLGRWFDRFPAEQIKVMFAEDISANPDQAAAEAFTFFGIDPTFRSAILSERRNESDRARFPVLRRGLRGAGDWMRRRGMEPVLARIKAQPTIAAMMKANKIDIRSEIPPMDPATRRDLEAYFASEVDALGDLLGAQPLPWTSWQNMSGPKTVRQAATR